MIGAFFESVNEIAVLNLVRIDVREERGAAGGGDIKFRWDDDRCIQVGQGRVTRKEM